MTARTRIFRLVATLALALALTLGIGARSAAPVGATAYGISTSACSYAGGYCTLRFCSWAGGTAYATWYVWTQGYAGERYTQVSVFNGCWMEMTIYVGPNTRADQVVISCPAACDSFQIWLRW